MRGNRSGSGSVQGAMTILDTRPPLRVRDTVRVSHTPLDDVALYRRLLLDAPAAGRCPVLLPGPAPVAVAVGWNPAAALAELEHRDAAAVLAGRYPPGCLHHPDCLAPFGASFPGLAPATTGVALLTRAEIAETAVEEAEASTDSVLAVVPVARPADVPAAVGWSGTGSDRDTVGVSAVLRSWEDRFGALLVRTGPATLELAVAAPPWERSECLAAAAEHFAFCDDTYRGNPGTLGDYANSLRGATRWSFRWS